MGWMVSHVIRNWERISDLSDSREYNESKCRPKSSRAECCKWWQTMRKTVKVSWEIPHDTWCRVDARKCEEIQFVKEDMGEENWFCSADSVYAQKSDDDGILRRILKSQIEPLFHKYSDRIQMQENYTKAW